MRRFWTVVETGHGREAEALRHVENQKAEFGFEGYLPRYRERVRGGVRRVLPLFPGYLFVSIDRRKGFRSLFGTRGIRRVIMWDAENPCRIDGSEINKLKSAEDDIGYVVLLSEEPPAFSMNEIVVAQRGMFARQSGVYVGKTTAQRCRVLWNIMGRSIESDMLLRDLAPA